MRIESKHLALLVEIKASIRANLHFSVLRVIEAIVLKPSLVLNKFLGDTQILERNEDVLIFEREEES